MRPPDQSSFAALELCDRAARFLADHGDATDEDLVRHVFGGALPVALRAKLLAPLSADQRLARQEDGRWSLRSASKPVANAAFTALALAATGPTPGRSRLVRVTALHVDTGSVVERFDAIVNPRRRVPRYVAQRIGLDTEVLDTQPTFGEVLDELVHFLGERPVLAQDVRLTWGFLASEARHYDRALVEPALIDINDLAAQRLDLKGKPTLAAVAARLGIATVQIGETVEEARVLALVGSRLLESGAAITTSGASAAVALRRSATAHALPDEPGIYILRDSEQQPLYVGKARRLRSRMAAYVHRPLGPTRRLEGLVGSVQAVDTTQCQTDLEALLLEDREIRRLQPRFNTVRQQRAPRYWIRWPPDPVGKKRAAPRLELSSGPGTAEGEFVGPFRNEMLAEQARRLARDVFQLDALRRSNAAGYVCALRQACQFLNGDCSVAERLARTTSVTLLRKVLAFDVAATLLPADPRYARYAVVRPGPTGVEGFLLDRAILVTWCIAGDDAQVFAQALLQAAEPRTAPDDVGVVLRWLGAQRPPARLVCLPDDPLAAADAIEDAVYALVPEA